MTRKQRPVETELDAELQTAVLSLSVELPDGSHATVGELVQRAEEYLRLANETVHNNALIQMTSTFLMKKDKRRGTPSVIVRMDGRAVLRVTYDGEGERGNGIDEVIKGPPPKEVLPTLDELRGRALNAGVDISDLGRNKYLILERLNGSASR